MLSLDNNILSYNLVIYIFVPVFCILLVLFISLLGPFKDLYWYYFYNSSSNLIFETLFIWPEQLLSSIVW